MTIVTNKNGVSIEFNKAVELMDESIREAVHTSIAPCSPQQLFTAYENAHAEEFGEEWALSWPNPPEAVAKQEA